MADPWDEPVSDEWVEKPARLLVNGDYIRDGRGERLRVLCSFSVGATVPYWYVEAYKPGEATRRIGIGSGDPLPVEVRGG